MWTLLHVQATQISGSWQKEKKKKKKKENQANAPQLFVLHTDQLDQKDRRK